MPAGLLQVTAGHPGERPKVPTPHGQHPTVPVLALALDHGHVALQGIQVRLGTVGLQGGEVDDDVVGGDKAVYDKYEPALKAIGANVFHCGDVGNGNVVKLVNNMLAFIHLVADGEALMLAKRGGLDLAQAWAAIKASSISAGCEVV